MKSQHAVGATQLGIRLVTARLRSSPGMDARELSIDIDGYLLTTNDPYLGSPRNGVSFPSPGRSPAPACV